MYNKSCGKAGRYTYCIIKYYNFNKVIMSRNGVELREDSESHRFAVYVNNRLEAHSYDFEAMKSIYLLRLNHQQKTLNT